MTWAIKKRVQRQIFKQHNHHHHPSQVTTPFSPLPFTCDHHMICILCCLFLLLFPLLFISLVIDIYIFYLIVSEVLIWFVTSLVNWLNCSVWYCDHMWLTFRKKNNWRKGKLVGCQGRITGNGVENKTFYISHYSYKAKTWFDFIFFPVFADHRLQLYFCFPCSLHHL